MHEERFDFLEQYCRAHKPFAGVQISAMIYNRGVLVGAGNNRNKSHPLAKRYSKNEHAIYIHAELDAMMNATGNNGSIPSLYGRDCTKGAVLYVLRLKYTDRSKKTLLRANAKPCKGCFQAIRDYGIKEVFYTTDDGFEKLNYEEYSAL